MSLNIKLKRSSVSGSTPTAAQLEDGELGVNYNANDPAIYLKDSAGSVVRIAGENAAGGYWNRSGTTLSPSTSGDVLETDGNIRTTASIIQCKDNPYQGANTGTQLRNGAFVASGASSNFLFLGYTTGTSGQTISIFGDGSILCGSNPFEGGGTGVSINPAGLFRASAVSGSPLWQGYLNGTTTPTSTITSQGSATLAGDLTIAGRIQHSGDTNTAIRFPANDEVSIETNGNEAVRVDVNGSLGIGTPDPQSRFHISGSENSDIRQTNTSSDSLNHYADANRDAVNQTIFKTQALWSGTEVASIQFLTGDDAVNKNNGRILFRTANTSGNVVARLGLSQSGIASFKSNTGLQAEFGVLEGSYHNGENYTRVYGNSSTNYVQTKACNTADDTNAFEITINGVNQAQIQADGDMQNVNGVYGQTSDERLKENIADAPSQWEDVKATKVRSFNFKEETGYSTHKQIGWVAQEVELVSPGCVSETASEDGEESTKSVKSSVLLIKAYKALQEAMERIETLEQRLDEVITE